MAKEVSPSFKYRVFLSYSHEDKKWARWLHRALETYRVPPHLVAPGGGSATYPKRIAPVFSDRTDLSSSASLPNTINEALEDSEFLVVICSPSAARSRWVNQEILTFKQLGKSRQILCFIVDGEPHAGGKTECFPEAMLFEPAEWELGARVDVEPLAADARAEGDGRNIAKLKLIAGVLGVGFDELRQRDIHRRHRRMLGVTVGSLVTALLTISLAIMAFMASAEAERRRAQAEDLIGFMLGDLREGLYEVGRLDVFMRVSDKVMDYFASNSNEGANDEMLHQRAEALRQIGSVRLDQGEVDLALESFRESFVIAQELANRNPANAEWQISLANSHFYSGYVHWQHDDLDAARTEFEATLLIVDGVSRRDPDNPKWLLERGYVYTNLGRILETQGRLSLALANYQEVKIVNDRLIALEPANTDYRIELGFAHNNIGNVMQSLGQFDAAEDHFDKDLEIKLAVSAEHPKNNLWKSYVLISHVFKGRILVARGQFGAARTQYASAINLIESLLAIEPEHTDWLEKKSSYQRELGAIYRRELNLESAVEHVEISIQAFKELLAIDGSVASWERGLAISQLEAARLAEINGNHSYALEFATKAQSTLSHLLKQSPSHQETRSQYVISQLVTGDIYAGMGKKDAAKHAWELAVEAIETEGFNTGTLEVTDLHSALLVRLDRSKEAEPLLARLQAIGYMGDWGQSNN